MSHISQKSTSSETAYEFKIVALMTIGFGLVGLDRFIINPLFPVIQKDLGMNYQDLGLISGVLALAWGLASVFSGPLSDRYGQKRILVPAVVIFSLLVAGTGLATGLFSMLLLRGMMGLSEGAYVPSSIVATIEASKPSRMGLNIGIQQMAAPLVGLGLGPVIAIKLLTVLPSWHWVFAVVALPGLLLAWLINRIMRNARTAVTAANLDTHAIDRASVKEILKLRPVLVNTVVMVCLLTTGITLAVFMPNYMTDSLHMSLTTMSQMMGGFGLGSFVGTVILPALSDRLGRKPMMLVGSLLSVGLIWFLPSVHEAGTVFFATIFLIAFMNMGVIAINVGPLTMLSVPPHLVTSATGFVVGLAEMLGGAVAPAVAGALAQNFGISVILQTTLVAATIGLMVILFGVKEPSKR